MEIAFVNTAAAAILLASLVFLCTLFAVAFCYNAFKQRRRQQRFLVDKINHLLPQTQCGQCGYEGCRPYARAISQGEPINQCPPGGNETIIMLAALLNDELKPLNPAHGELEEFKVAVIREDECIGCTKCIKACPVDAILGGPKLMHTVIQTECTGCDLCVDPCPVDCIDMVLASPNDTVGWSLPSEIDTPKMALRGEA